MSEKIIGVTVGTTMNPKQIAKNVEVTEENITNALGFKPAPSGYGLGTNCASIDSVKNIVASGWYLTNVDTPDGKWWYCEARVSGGGTGIVIDAWKVGNNIRASRYKAGDEWSEWEWQNPPMTDGTEYRTTKRLAEKPVYVQCGSLGALPSSSTTAFSVSTSGSKLDRILMLSVEAYNTSNRKYMLPFINTSGEIRAIVYATGARTFTIKTFSDLSDYSARYYIEYTKA